MKNDTKEGIDKLGGHLAKIAPLPQLALGSTSGWITGFLTAKSSKPIAFALGGGIILFQLAQTQAITKVTWDDLHQKAQNFSDKNVKGKAPSLLAKSRMIAKANIPFTAGFIGGFLLGMST